jgi:hypothetical protein
MARSGIGRSPIADRPTKGHRLRVPGVDWFAARRSSNAVVTKKEGVGLILGLSDTSSVLHEVEPIL